MIKYSKREMVAGQGAVCTTPKRLFLNINLMR